MRVLGVVAAWCLGVAAGVVAIVAGWSMTHLQDPAGFAELGEGTVEDRRVRDAATATASQQLVERANLPQAIGDYVRRALDENLAEVVADPEGLTAWRATLTSSHRLALENPGEPLLLDLGPVAQAGLDRLTGQLPVTLEVPQPLTVVAAQAPPTATIDAIDRSDQVRDVALVVTAVAALAVVLFARRRLLALAAVGAGAVASALVTGWLANGVLPARIDAAVPETTLAVAFGSALADVAAGSLTELALTVGGAGAVVALAGISAWGAARGTRRGSTSPSAASSPEHAPS